LILKYKQMIKIKNISKSYYGHAVIKDLVLNIEKGLVFGFLGPNGAGKTTTIKMLVGLNKPDSGKILIGDRDPSDTESRRKIGFMPENPYFYDHLTGLELLKFCGELSSAQIQPEGYETALKEVGLFDSKNQMIREYSKGMKQRLGLAQAIIHNPEYVFLDEPLDGLDPIGRIEIKDIIDKLKNRGSTIFFNSHILSDVEDICDQIGIINKGKLIYNGSVVKFRGKKSLEKAFVELIKKQSQ
jgi:ABC-2 type transport system ATP-binding protein